MQELLENKLMDYKEIPLSELKQTLEECFATDLDLMNRWHIEAPAPLFQCVERTYNDLRSCPDIIFYKIHELSKLIGYFCKETDKHGNNYLTGFFLKPEYRRKEYKDRFWEMVKEVMKGEEFFAGLYEKNVRGDKFLQNSGGEYFFKGVDANGNNFISYKFN